MTYHTLSLIEDLSRIGLLVISGIGIIRWDWSPWIPAGGFAVLVAVFTVAYLIVGHPAAAVVSLVFIPVYLAIPWLARRKSTSDGARRG